MKRLLISYAFLLISCSLFAQLKVDQAGRIGIGTLYPNSSYKCHIAGNLLLSSYPETPFYELRLKVGNDYHGVEIGSSSGEIHFWSTTYAYNSLYAKDYYKVSDSTLKVNIKPLNDGIGKIMKLNTYSYSYRFPKSGNRDKSEFGFISQEVAQILPQITDTVEGVILMDYDQIIPLLVEAVKDQQQKIMELEAMVSNISLNKIDNTYEGNETGRTKDGFTENLISPSKVEEFESLEPKLFGNVPNPFTSSTSIKFFIPNASNQAFVNIYTLQGEEVRSFKINERGNNFIDINLNELKSGLYLYSLIVDYKVIATKSMVLMK